MSESSSPEGGENAQLSREKFELDELKAKQDFELRQRELELKQREIAVKEKETKEGTWRNPFDSPPSCLRNAERDPAVLHSFPGPFEWAGANEHDLGYVVGEHKPLNGHIEASIIGKEIWGSDSPARCIRLSKLHRLGVMFSACALEPDYTPSLAHEARGGVHMDCTPKVRHQVKGPITLNGRSQCLCPDNNIPVN